MNRRDFLGIAAASIFAPRFGRWYRQGSGLIVRDVEAEQPTVTHTGFHFGEWGYVITATTATTMTVEYLPKSRHPANPRLHSGGHLRSRALFSDALTGLKPKPSEIRGANVSDFRVGDVLHIPRPFGDGLMLLP